MSVCLMALTGLLIVIKTDIQQKPAAFVELYTAPKGKIQHVVHNSCVYDCFCSLCTTILASANCFKTKRSKKNHRFLGRRV